jgi:hypothetical protein
MLGCNRGNVRSNEPYRSSIFVGAANQSVASKRVTTNNIGNFVLAISWSMMRGMRAHLGVKILSQAS